MEIIKIPKKTVWKVKCISCQKRKPIYLLGNKYYCRFCIKKSK